jgi:hypothetical protein
MRVIEDISLSERNGRDKPGQWLCVLWKEKRGSRNGL